MENLPNEIIELILKNSNLDIKDVVNFSLTCIKFRNIVYLNSSLWRTKYFQCWPRTDPSISIKDWHNECILRKNFERNVHCLLSYMSSKFYHIQLKNINDAELDFVNDLLNSHSYGYFYLKDCLLTINLLPVTLSLTEKYYGSILLKFINKKHYTEVWNQLLNLNNKEQTLEKGAIFVSNWCQENGIDILPLVTDHLNQIANLVKQHLLQHHKDHPLKSVSQDTFLTWEKENLLGNMFEPNFCKLIIDSINHILFEHFNYCIAYDLSYLDRTKCGIDYAIVDKRATPLIFAVIYESVARRVGVKIEILEFLDHCLLKWKENYMSENTLSHYISINNKGMFMKAGQCPRSYGNNLTITPCDMLQIAQRVAFNIYPREREENQFSIKDALELVLVIMPFSFEWYQELSRSYMLHDMDVRKLLSNLLTIRPGMTEEERRLFQPLFHSLEIYQKTWQREHNNIKSTIPKFRTKEVKFAVGMIVRDKRFDSTGIIYGWDLVCETPQSNDSAPQPFYKILGGDGSNQYVAQKNLQILHSPPFISHPFMGRFFEEYRFSYFKPNKELQEEYPQDEDVLLRILKNDRTQNMSSSYI